MSLLSKFEIYCIDQKGKVAFKSVESLIEAISINETIWKGKLQKNYEKRTIIDKTQTLHLKIDVIDTTKVFADLFTSAFIITIESRIETLEPLRIEFLKHLRFLGFDHIRILTCDVTNELAVKIYPLIHKIENQLRRYITKFFISKIGLSWFEISVSVELKSKIKIRKDNELVFTKSGIVNTDVTLIDFNELGEIITRQTSVYSKVEDVIDKINNSNSLEELKNEVSGNYPKYFKTFFEKQNFENKWKTLNEIRNRVAHNNYLSLKDFEDADKLVTELEKIISEAEDKVDEAVLTVTEKQAINKAIQKVATEQLVFSSDFVNKTDKDEQIIEDNFYEHKHKDSIISAHFSVLTEERVLSELKILKQKNPTWKFVALSQLYDHLEELGFYRSNSAALTSILIDKKILEIEQIRNPQSTFYKTTAIKEVNGV